LAKREDNVVGSLMCPCYNEWAF